MKKIVLLLLLISGFSNAQSLNDYKYVILPVKFDFLSAPDKYNLNSTTKALLEKYGFVTFFNDDKNVPAELIDYNCGKLFANVESVGSFITTKLLITLKDCKGNVLFSSEGKSREKDFKISFNQALRDAAKGFDSLGYKYNGTITSVEKSTVRKIDNGTTVRTEIVATTPSSTANSLPSSKDLLFAQPLENGYQLIDSTPKVVMKIYSTSVKDVFLAERGTDKGTLLNKNGNWTFEFYKNGALVSDTLNIKF